MCFTMTTYNESQTFCEIENFVQAILANQISVEQFKQQIVPLIKKSRRFFVDGNNYIAVIIVFKHLEQIIFKANAFKFYDSIQDLPDHVVEGFIKYVHDQAGLIEADYQCDQNEYKKQVKKAERFLSEELFGPYLKGVKHITITDPYIRLFFQARNLMELLETIVKLKAEEDEIVVSLVTVEDELKGDQQREFFDKIQNEMFTVGIKFAYSFDNSGSQHARHIVTNTGWKISLDRGLDIFQQYDMGDAFQLANRNQKYRACKAFEVTYIKLSS